MKKPRETQKKRKGVEGNETRGRENKRPGEKEGGW